MSMNSGQEASPDRPTAEATDAAEDAETVDSADTAETVDPGDASDGSIRPTPTPRSIPRAKRCSALRTLSTRAEKRHEKLCRTIHRMLTRARRERPSLRFT